MTVYSIIMFIVAALFLIFGVFIHNGNTKLIHDYHQARIKEADQKDYGRAFAKGMFSVALTLIFSGIVALFGKESPIAVASVAILFIGLVISFMLIVKVQKKYNGGLF